MDTRSASLFSSLVINSPAAETTLERGVQRRAEKNLPTAFLARSRSAGKDVPRSVFANGEIFGQDPVCLLIEYVLIYVLDLSSRRTILRLRSDFPLPVENVVVAFRGHFRWLSHGSDSLQPLVNGDYLREVDFLTEVLVHKYLHAFPDIVLSTFELPPREAFIPRPQLLRETNQGVEEQWNENAR